MGALHTQAPGLLEAVPLVQEGTNKTLEHRSIIAFREDEEETP